MDDCCNKKASEIEVMRSSHARVLWAVLAINAAMFVVEIIFGILSKSTALKADSLDMLGDSLVSRKLPARNLSGLRHHCGSRRCLH